MPIDADAAAGSGSGSERETNVSVSGKMAGRLASALPPSKMAGRQLREWREIHVEFK